MKVRQIVAASVVTLGVGAGLVGMAAPANAGVNWCLGVDTGSGTGCNYQAPPPPPQIWAPPPPQAWYPGYYPGWNPPPPRSKWPDHQCGIYENPQQAYNPCWVPPWDPRAEH